MTVDEQGFYVDERSRYEISLEGLANYFKETVGQYQTRYILREEQAISMVLREIEHLKFIPTEMGSRDSDSDIDEEARRDFLLQENKKHTKPLVEMDTEESYQIFKDFYYERLTFWKKNCPKGMAKELTLHDVALLTHNPFKNWDNEVHGYALGAKLNEEAKAMFIAEKKELCY